jgi:DNA repair protein RadC
MTSLPPVQPLGLREKLATSGAKALSDTELLAVFISSGSGKKSCLQLASELVAKLGDLRSILNADLQTFKKVKGLNIVRFLQLQAVREICLRSDFISLKKSNQLADISQTYTYIKRHLRDRKNETFAALFLDGKQRVIHFEELFHGTINAASVHARPLIERALALNAAFIIIAHNHPSGHSVASPQDLHVTERLRDALGLIDVELLDHLIIGDNEVYSIAQKTKWVCQ